MEENEVSMLYDALELYAELLNKMAPKYKYDEFCEMRQKLSDLIGHDVH